MLSDSELSSSSWPTKAAPGCHLSTVQRHLPHSSGRRRRHGRHDIPHSPSARPFSPFLPHARLRRRKRRRHCCRALRELRPCASLRLTSPLSVSKSASSSSIFSTPRLDEISSRWAAFREFVVVGFTAVATPIPANLAAAPSLSLFFPLSRVKVCLGLDVGSRHAILAFVPPPRGNTGAAPLCSPPTSTSHVSRLTGAIRVRRFYLESSALTHWCLSRLSPTLYRSEMADGDPSPTL